MSSSRFAPVQHDRVHLVLADHLGEREAELGGAHRAGERDEHLAAVVEMRAVASAASISAAALKCRKWCVMKRGNGAEFGGHGEVGAGSWSTHGRAGGREVSAPRSCALAQRAATPGAERARSTARSRRIRQRPYSVRAPRTSAAPISPATRPPNAPAIAYSAAAGTRARRAIAYIGSQCSGWNFALNASSPSKS